MQYFTLNHRVALYVPSTSNVSKKINAKEHNARTKEVAAQLADMFGGSTSYKALGYYRANDMTTVIENVQIVIAFASDEQIEQQSTPLLEYAATLASLWGQESILVEIDDKKIFVEGA